MTRSSYIAVLGSIAMGFPALATPILNLTPSGTVSGLPGSTAGWGYSITNDKADVLLVANSYFCQSGQDPLFTTCTQSLGTYNDFIASNATEIAPGSTASQSFNALASNGVGEYTISGLATAGQTDSGLIVLVYDLFTCDPFTACGAIQIGGDVEVSAAADVQVTAPTSGVPEPGTLVLLGSAFAALAAFQAVRSHR
jgi:hypothetical protein